MASSAATNATTYRVIYGDTDQMGVAYYANYLRWFEIGRTELLRQLSLPYTGVEGKGLHFPVIEVSCRYLKPARYDDTIRVETTLTALGHASLTFAYKIYRGEAEEMIATGWTKHACVDRHGEIAKIAPETHTILEKSLARK